MWEGYNRMRTFTKTYNHSKYRVWFVFKRADRVLTIGMNGRTEARQSRYWGGFNDLVTIKMEHRGRGIYSNKFNYPTFKVTGSAFLGFLYYRLITKVVNKLST